MKVGRDFQQLKSDQIAVLKTCDSIHVITCSYILWPNLSGHPDWFQAFQQAQITVDAHRCWMRLRSGQSSWRRTIDGG